MRFRFFSLYRVELKRLLLTKQMWLIFVLCLFSPLLGYSVYKPVSMDSMLGDYISNPVLAGTSVGAILWAIIAIVEADRQRRSGTNVLADSVTLPIKHAAAKMSALITISSVITVLCSVVYLPYTVVKLDYLFLPEAYFLHFFVFMLPTWWISILFAEGFYRITQHVELSAVMYAALIYMCYSRFADRNYFLRWLNPIAEAYSDGFPDVWFLRLGAYTRLVWLCIAAGVWTCSLICMRKYEKGLIGSFVKGLKKVFLPISTAVLVTVGIVLWNVQPFIGNGGEKYNEESEIDFLQLSGVTTDIKHFINIDATFGTLSGRSEYRIEDPIKGESVFRLNAGYKVTNITYDGESVNFRTIKKDINGQYDTCFKLPAKHGKKLVIEYAGFPTVAQSYMPAVYNSIGKNYIYLNHTSFVPLLADYGLVDYGYGGGKCSVEVTLPGNLMPFIQFEPLTKFVENGDGTRTYNTDLDVGYIYNFIAGNYVTDNFSSSGSMNFKMVYGDIYRSSVEEYNVQQSICDVYDYCTAHYGKYPFMNGNSLTLFQLSSMTNTGYSIAGTSTWNEDVINPNTLSDSNKGATATETFIHEMIHQWWGNYLWFEDDGLWSAEGLTVYSTYRFVKEKYGELYAKQYYVDEWQKAVDEQDRSFYNRHPEYLDRLPKQYRERLSASDEAINCYKRMPLMILKAEELVGGEEKMDEILGKMFSDYFTDFFQKDEQRKVTYKEFLDYCGLTEEDLSHD